MGKKLTTIHDLLLADLYWGSQRFEYDLDGNLKYHGMTEEKGASTASAVWWIIYRTFNSSGKELTIDVLGNLAWDARASSF